MARQELVWDVFLPRKVDSARTEVALDQINSTENVPIRRIVRPEGECVENRPDHSAVRLCVLVALHAGPSQLVTRLGGLRLLDQAVHGLLRDHGEDHVTDCAIRVSDAGLGDFVEQVLLAVDDLDLLHDLLHEGFVRLRINQPDELEEELSDAIEDLDLTSVHQNSEQGEPNR